MSRTAQHGVAVAILGAMLWAATPGALQMISRQARNYRSEKDFPSDSTQVTLDRQVNRIQSETMAPLQLTALAGPKANMMSFQIDRLSNPEIRIPRGTRLTLNVVNIDDDMVHDLFITRRAPPYPRKLEAGTEGTVMLRPYKGQRFSGAVLILKATQPGTLYYVCTIPGHAKAGMFGKIVITP